MFEISCYDEKFKPIRHLVQWDINRFIIVKNIETEEIPEFHFCNKKTELAIPVMSKLIKDEDNKNCYMAEIPDILLQQQWDIIVYIYVDSLVQNKISSKTAHMAKIPLVPRQKPEDYPYEVVESHTEYLGQLIAKATEIEEMLNGKVNSFFVQSDHAQNDPEKSDYIKNRIAYYCRKFDDIEAVDYPKKVFASITTNESEPVFLKFAEMPENATATEIINELIGVIIQGKELKFDDPEAFSEEMKASLFSEDLLDEEGKSIGSCLKFGEQPFIVCVNLDNAICKYSHSYEQDGEIVEIPLSILFPEKGIYTEILDMTEDENGVVKYLSFDKILFKDVVRLDKELLPPEILSPAIVVDDYPKENSENPITSGAVYNLKTTHDKRIEQIETNHNSLLSTVNGHTKTFEKINDTISKKMTDVPVTISDNGKILMVENGEWKAIMIPFAEEEEY